MLKIILSFSILVFMLFSRMDMYAQKTDTIFHVNGNILTGEIKKVVDGILLFKMEGMGSINIEVEKINTFKSPKLLQVRTKNGELIFGNIDTSFAFGYVKVGYGINKTDVLIMDIVEVFPIKSTFWLRTSGRFDLGLDYAKSTAMIRVNTSGEIEHRIQKRSYKIIWNTYASSQKIDTSIILTRKADASFTYKSLIKGPWLWTASYGENSNSELGLDLRLFLGFAIQNDIIYTTRQHLFAQVGANYNREFPTDGRILNNPEGLLSLSYYVYKHTAPVLTLSSHIELYPNLQFNGRWRMDTHVQISYEVFIHFYIGFKVYSNFDSRPTTANAESLDWGSSFTIGYSFN